MALFTMPPQKEVEPFQLEISEGKAQASATYQAQAVKAELEILAQVPER